MTLLGSASFQVHAGAEHKLPVKVDATGLRPGDYEGVAGVICETCGKEKGCTQDRQNLHVVMTVLPALTAMPQQAKEQKCDCTVTAQFPKEGGKDDKDTKDKKRKVTVEEGKASVEFGISGTVKTSKQKDQKVHPIVSIRYYFTRHNTKAKAWEKVGDPQELTVDKGELPCDGKTTPFEKWFSVPVPAGPAGQQNVSYELHLYAYSTKDCKMTPVRGYLTFVVTYDDKGKAGKRPANDKDAQDEYPYDKDGRTQKGGSSHFGFDGKGNVVLPPK